MYKPSGGLPPPNVRETSPLPLENPTWHKEPSNRDPRTDRTDRDRLGAGKRHWNGERSSSITSFQGVTSGVSLNGSGFMPRSKPRFQGHYSGFFAETGRNGPSFSAAGPLDTGLVRRLQRNPNPFATSPASKSHGFGGSVGVDYRASEERHNRDQFLPFGDDIEGRDRPLPPHSPRVHSDSLLLQNGEKTLQLGSRHWEHSPRIDRDLTRPHGNTNLYSSSRRRSIITGFYSGKDCGLGDRKSEVGRFDRFGNGSRDGPRADYEGSSKDTGFSHGWRRERGNLGVTARHSSVTGGSRNSGELGVIDSLSVGSAHNSLHVSMLSATQDSDQPSPSKRPRLGWGQGLAKYEKEVDGFPLAEKTYMKTDREGDTHPTLEIVEKKRGAAQEKLFVSGWEHECKQQHSDSFIDTHWRRGEDMMKTTLPKKDHGSREVSGKGRTCALAQDSLRSGENQRKPALAQEFRGLERRCRSTNEMEDNEKIMRGIMEKKGSIFSDNEELEVRSQRLASPVLTKDNERRGFDYEGASGVFKEHEFFKENGQNLTPSVLMEERMSREGEVAKSTPSVVIFEDVLGGSCEDSSLAELLNNEKHDLIISDTLVKAETREGDTSSNFTSVTECGTGGRRNEASLPFSPQPHSEIIAEDGDVVSLIGPSLEMCSAGYKNFNSPRSHVVDDFLAAPAPPLLTESVVLPASSANHLSARESSSNHQCSEQDVAVMSIDGRPLIGEGEVLEEPGLCTFAEMDIAPQEILVEDPEVSQLLVCEDKTDLCNLHVRTRAVLPTKSTITQVAASSDPFMSQVREQVLATTKSDATLPESEPASDGTSIVYSCVSENLNDVNHAVLLDSASQTEKSILETVETVEAEINSVKKEIAHISSDLSGDVSLEVSGTFHARVLPLDSPSKLAGGDDIPAFMEEDTRELRPCSVDTGVVRPSSCQSLRTAVYTRLEKSPICSERDFSSTRALLLRESRMTRMPEKGVLKLVSGRVELKSASFDEYCDDKVFRGARSVSFSRSLGLVESAYSENQFCNEVATGGSLLRGRTQRMIESLMMENKEKARLSGTPFVHLLPQSLTGTIDHQLYHSPIEAPVWQHNVETHMNIHGRLLEKLVERRHFIKFKERVLTVRYRALKEAWKREQMGLFARKNRAITVGSWDGEGISSYVHPSRRSFRLRPLSLDRLAADSDAAQAVKTLMKNPQVEALRSVFKMPAMILDGKERAIRRFVSRNALVEDPIAVEMERKAVNVWTAEERKIFAEKFAVLDKNFKEIASYLHYKTIADCVEYYYRNQKSEEFGKSQHGIQLKNRWDFTKTRSAFLTPTPARIKRNHEANCARIEALNVANVNMKLSQSNIPLQVSEHAIPSSDSLTMPPNVEMQKFLRKENKPLEVALQFPATVETAASSMISIPCSMSSIAARLTDHCKQNISVMERRSRPATTRSFHSEENPGGLKGARSAHLRRMSSRTAAQEHSQWTDAERELFTSAVAAYGKNFRLIASLVSTKSQSQCKAFFSKTRKRLCLDELVEQFQANEAAAMLVQSFRHDAGLVQEAKRISTSKNVQMNASAEELIDTAAAVSTLESLKEQSKCLAIDTSDLNLVADAAAVLGKITLVKPEVSTLDLFSSDKTRPSSQDLACELLKVNRLNSAVPFTLLMKEDDEDSEATKSDGSYLVGGEAETDIVVDQAAAALIGMSEMLADGSGSQRDESEAKFDTNLFPVGVTSRLQSTRISPPLHAVTEANLSLTSGRTARRAKVRVNSTIFCKTITRDRPHEMYDAHTGRKWRKMAGGEPKPRREPTSWTREEKERFAVILQEHGKDWALLHKSLPLKSLTQIKTYFQNSKARSRLPASDKLLTVVRNHGANRKRKADEFESTRRATELALPVKQKVGDNVAPAELKSATHKESILLGSASVAGTAGVGEDILIHAARFRKFSGQLADQDSLSTNGMQHLVCQMGSTQDGHQVIRPGPRSALPPSVVSRPHTPGRIQQLLAVSGPSEAGCPNLQAQSPVVVAGSSAAIHQVAQQVQQMLQQQKHLQNQLKFLIQQQEALPPQLIPQHEHVTQETLQAVRPLEEKLHQVVQQLHQQYELQGRAPAPCQEEGHCHTGYFQHQQITPARGILKVKPIRGVVPQPLVDPATSPFSGVLLNEAKSESKDTKLRQHHSLSLGIGTIPIVTTGSTAGAQENHAKPVELHDSDTDTDCEGSGSRLMITEDSHWRMSKGHSSYSGQKQNTTQSTTSTLSSDSEQMKSWDVKLFGQSLLSKPPPLPSSLPRSTGSLTQEFLIPNASAFISSGTLSKEFRTFESLPSAFGRVGAASITAERQQHAPSWPGSTGVWSTTSSFQLSGRTERIREELDPESVQETVTSLAAQSNGEILVLALEQTSQGDDEHLSFKT